MTIQNSTEEFDGWSKLSVYAVVEEKSINVWSFWFGKSGGLNNTTNSSWHFMSRRPDLNPPRYRFRINGTSGGDTPEINGAFFNLVHDPMILTLIYDGASGKRQAFINGTMVINQSNDTGNIHSTNHPLSIGGKPTPDSWGGVQTNYSEFIVLNHVLNPNQHLELEGFLAHKWSLQEELPENHEYKSSPPVSAAKDFDFFNGEIDDLRIYNRALTNEEINSIYTGDLTEEKHSGGQDPQVTLYWGNEDGGYNLDINSSSPDAWDHKLDLGNIKMGTFSTSIEGLQAGTRYFYRLHAENDAGSQWSPTSGTFSAGSFSFAAERWTDNDLLLWLDASDINGDGDEQNEPFGGKVDQWLDKSGKNRHAGNGFGPSLLSAELNQKNILSFDGENHYLRIPDYQDGESADLDLGLEGSIFLLLLADDLNAGNTLLSKGWNINTGWAFISSASGMPDFGIRGTTGEDEMTSNLNWPDAYGIFSVEKQQTKGFFESMDFRHLSLVMKEPVTLQEKMTYYSVLMEMKLLACLANLTSQKSSYSTKA